MKEKTNIKTLRLAQMAMLCAILLLMAYTPLGYLRVGPVEITFLTIPVMLGAMVLGPGYGAALGALFGLTSFLQCFSGSPFGAMLLSIQPVFTALICLLPRILVGLFCGLVFRRLRGRWFSYPLAALTATASNTVLFVGMLLLLFGHTEYIQSFGSNIWQIIAVLVGLNALIELLVCTAVGALLAKACDKYLQNRG